MSGLSPEFARNWPLLGGWRRLAKERSKDVDSRPQEPASIKSSLTKTVESKRATFISLQWVDVISTSYLALFNQGQVVEDPLVFALIGFLLVSVFDSGQDR